MSLHVAPTDGPVRWNAGAVHTRGGPVEHNGSAYEAGWWLVFDAQTVVITDYVAEEDRLVITATVATPDAEQRHHIYEQLLQYNYHWEDTGSVRMAIDEPAGDLVQIADLRVTGLELQTLHDALRIRTQRLHFCADLPNQQRQEGVQPLRQQPATRPQPQRPQAASAQ